MSHRLNSLRSVRRKALSLATEPLVMTNQFSDDGLLPLIVGPRLENVNLGGQDVFQTTDRAKVEEYCRQARTDFEWKSK